MNWSHGWGLAGQILALWIFAGVMVVVAWNIAKAAYERRERRRYFIDVLTRNKAFTLPRAELIVAVAHDLEDAGYQRARIAEGAEDITQSRAS